MNAIKSLLKWSAILLLATSASGTAWADRGYRYGHGGAHFGFVFGAPFSPWYLPYSPYSPYSPYYYAPPVIIERAPPVYIEQAPAASAPGAQSNTWYYCNESRTYYPYVTECPGGWQRVAPQAPAPR